MNVKKSGGVIDGKLVKKFVFGRASRVLTRMHDGRLQRLRVIVEVEAFDKDHAVRRLEEKWPSIPRGDWDFIDSYDFDCDIGMMGEKMPLSPPSPRGQFLKMVLSSIYGKFARK